MEANSNQNLGLVTPILHIFVKNKCAGGKFKVLTLCRVNGMANKI